MKDVAAQLYELLRKKVPSTKVSEPVFCSIGFDLGDNPTLFKKHVESCQTCRKAQRQYDEEVSATYISAAAEKVSLLLKLIFPPHIYSPGISSRDVIDAWRARYDSPPS